MKFWAKPLSAVKADQTVSEMVMIQVRSIRSASQAMGTPSVEESRAKAMPPNRPSCSSLSPSSSLIGMARMEMIWRSRKLKA